MGVINIKMTELDYKQKMQIIESEYLQAKKNLYIEYAISQRKFKIGDIIKDHNNTIIEISKFGTCMTLGLPKPTYIGRELRKDLVKKKNGDIATIYGNIDVKLIKG
jgi:hypothetical protein